MSFILGYLVRIVTLPGLVVDAFVNKMVCQIMEIEVSKVNYIAIDPKELPVVHAIPDRYYKVFGLSVLPFFIITTVSILIFYLGFWLVNESPAFIIPLYLGISIGAHAFPNTTMGSLLWKSSITEIKSKNYLAIIGIPVVIFIYIARILHIFWLDVLYGIVLFFLVYSTVR